MQIQAVGLLLAIKRVALDGIVETLLVGAMHAQLMGAPCVGNESDAVISQGLIFSQGRLAVLCIYHLSRPVQRIGP